jgi:branched-chain amino acid transport system substrate-binding protein
MRDPGKIATLDNCLSLGQGLVRIILRLKGEAFTMIRHLARVLALGVATLAFGIAPAAPARAADPLEIYALAPLTGPLAFYGQGVQASLVAEAAAINAAGGVHGRNLHFTVLDDQGNPQIAVQLVAPLPAKGVPIIIDAGPAATCYATTAALKSNAVVFCLSTAYEPRGDSYSFTTPFSLEAGMAAQVRFFRKRGLKRIAFITATDATGVAADVVTTNLLAYPENKDVVAVARERFGNSDISVTAQIARIRNANPQAIFALGSGPSLALIFREMRDAGLALPTATLAVNQNAKLLASYGPIVPADLEMVSARWSAFSVMGAGPVKDRVVTYFRTLKNAGVSTDGPASLPWDAVLFMADAYRKLGDTPSPTALRDYIAAIHNVAGIDGFYDFPATPGRGLTSKDSVVLRWNGKKQTFDPVSTAGGQAPL